MNAHCSKIQQMLVEYLYEELPEDRAVWVQQHLAACGNCRDEFELSRRTLRTIDAVTRDRSRAMPTAGLLQRLNREIDTRPEYHRPRQPRRVTLPSLALAAAFLFGVFAAPFLYQWYSSKDAGRAGPWPDTHPIYSNVTGSNPFARPNEDSGQPPGGRLRNDPLPAIEEELEQLTQPATLGRRSSGRSGGKGSNRSGSVISSTPEGF